MTQPYPVLHVKMDGSDIVTSGTKTTLTEYSGNGIDALLENVTATADKNAAAGGALFFNGYQIVDNAGRTGIHFGIFFVFAGGGTGV